MQQLRCGARFLLGLRPALLGKGVEIMAHWLFKRAALTLVIAAACAPAAAADNAFASFNGTQGAGNFFYGKLVGSTFTRSTACGNIDFPMASCLGSGSYPYFGVAASAGPFFGATLPTDRLLTHTSTEALSLIVWRAPGAGEYRIDGLFSLHHPDRQLGNGIGVTGYFQAAGQAALTVPRFVLNTAEATVSVTRTFAANDFYGFVLDDNGLNAYDLSGANMTATFMPSVGGVPEPATWAMLITGFGLVGSAARRTRVRQPG